MASLPYEQRGRLTWDPEYRAKHPSIASSESSEDDGDSIYEAPTGPYVSGGRASRQIPAVNSTAQRGTSTSANPKGLGQDGFQNVSYKRTRRMPRRTNLHFNRDNAAKAAFRRREPPSGSFILPRDCNEIEPSQTRMYDFLEELGVRSGSFIRPPQHIRDRKIQLWGSAPAIARTQTELRNWLNPLFRTRTTISKYKPTDKFASIASTEGEKFKRIQRNITLDAEKKTFQQVPDKLTTFVYTGWFLWPADEITPTEHLGAGLEALDPLRTKFKCHIIFDTKLSIFKILTDKEGSVEKTLLRLEGIVKEYFARVNRPIVRYYIDPPTPSSYRKEIQTVPSDTILPKSSYSLPLMTGPYLQSGEHNEWLQKTAILQHQSSHGAEAAIRKTIPDLRFYSGNIRLRVHFGTFALSVFRWPGTVKTIPFEDFMENMAMQGTKGIMLRDLHIRKSASSIIDKVHRATHLFQPVDSYTEKLKDIPLCFSAHITCQEDDKPPVTFEVEMIGNATDSNLYEKTYAHWSRSGRRDYITPMELFTIRLDRSSSWKLQASIENIIDRTRTTPKMAEFAESVKLKKTPGARIDLTGEKVFQWDKTPGGMMVTSFEQKTSLRYRLLSNMDYMIEISRYDTYDISTTIGQSLNPSNQPQIKGNLPHKTDWAATLWNNEWDTTFIPNSSLGVGEAASWDERLGTFFPCRSGGPSAKGAVDEGIKEFLQVVGDINNFLKDLKN